MIIVVVGVNFKINVACATSVKAKLDNDQTFGNGLGF